MLRRTPLYQVHRALGATFRETEGWEIPVQFTNPEREYRSVRNRAGISDLSSRGRIRVKGKDRERFLQGMITNDVHSLAPGSGCYAAMLTPKGKVRTDLFLYAEPESFWIDVGAAGMRVLKETLEKYIIAEDVRLEDLTGSLGLLSLQGPDSPSLLGQLLDGDLPGEEFFFVERRVGEHPVRLIRRTGYTREEGFEIVAPTEALPDLWERIRNLGAEPIGTAALEILRVESGIPASGQDLDESVLAMEAPLESAISLTKGCYIGQEFVARIRDRGKVNRRFVGLRITGKPTPQPGDRILADGKEIGRITSAVFSPRLQSPIALGFVRQEHSETGCRLQVASREGLLPATVAPLPFPREFSRKD